MNAKYSNWVEADGDRGQVIGLSEFHDGVDVYDGKEGWTVPIFDGDLVTINDKSGTVVSIDEECVVLSDSQGEWTVKFEDLETILTE